MMRTTAEKPATTPIPVQLSDREFAACICPHLSMPKRGPKGTLGDHGVFTLILWVLYTGRPWQCLPLPQDAQGKPAIPDTTVYNVLPHGPMTGRSGKRSWPVWPIARTRRHLTSACSMATGPTPWPKKGDGMGYWGTNPEGRASHRDHGQPWRCVSSLPVAPVKETDMVLLRRG